MGGRSPEYFDVLGISYLSGRHFDEMDRKGSPWVGIVNETFATQYFGSSSPVGRSLLRVGPQAASVEIVAVVRNSKGSTIKESQPVTLYVPVHQFYDIFPWGLPNVNVLLETNVKSPASLSQGLTQTIQSIDPDLPLFNVQTLTDYIYKGMANERLLTDLLAAFACLAIILAMAGSYGLMSQVVNSRMREIGIRLSLGASFKHLILLVTFQHCILLVAGTACGTMLFFWLARFLRSFLYGLKWTDAPVLAVAVTVMVCAGVLAVWVPVRKIKEVECAVILRQP